MAASGGVIYEEFLYKLTGNKGKSFWNKSNPWKQRYFIVKTDGNRPILEYHAKKPRNRNATPKETISLAGGFRLEKVTNTRNRAYVFELTTGDKYLCLSSDEQRHMDMFVFVLQAQIRLRDQIKEDLAIVQPENSESQRRIGAKGTNCILHISPWGVTLALQSCRSVLAQWPLKSVRYFEASGTGKFMLEAGRIAPMGDGIYVFQTAPGEDNKLYDMLDQHIVNALGKIQPGRRGTTEEVEDYVEEAEKLSALTNVCLFTPDNPSMAVIFMENWNTELPTTSRPMIIHNRQNSLSSSNSDASVPPPLPSRLNSRTAQNSPRLIRSPATTNSNSSSRQHTSQHTTCTSQGTALSERPPLPPPTNQTGSVRSTTRPIGIPRNHSEGNILSNENYFRMNSSSSTSSKFQSPTSLSGMWSPPPSFQEVVGEIGSSYTKDGTLPAKDGYLTPRASAEMAAQSQVNTEDYILPSPKEERKFNSLTRPNSGVSNKHKRSPRHRASKFNRLRSNSCEEMTDYLQGFSATNRKDATTDENENVQTYDLAKPLNPFPKLQHFHGSMELLSDHPSMNSENYYNIQGLKGEVDLTNNPRVSVVRRKFNDMCRESLTRSVSNPNFLQIQNKEQLINVRSSALKSGSLTRESQNEHKQKSKSLLNLFRSKTNRRQSDGSQVVSSSVPSSPTGTLMRQTSTPNIVINVPGIYITEKTRSFRRPKSRDGRNSSPKLPTKRKDKSVSPAIKRPVRSSTEGVVIRHSREGSNSSSSGVSTQDKSGPENSSPVKYTRQDSGTVTLPVRHSREGSGPASPRHSREGPANPTPRHSREGSGSGAGKQGSSNQLINFSRQSSSSSASTKVQTTC